MLTWKTLLFLSGRSLGAAVLDCVLLLLRWLILPWAAERGLGEEGELGGGRRCVSNASEGVARREGLSATSARPTARRSAGRACAGFPFIRV